MKVRAKKNIIKLIGDVDIDMYNSLLNKLQRTDSLKPITVVLNTGGGDFYQALAIFDLLKSVAKRVPVYIIAEGHVMSSGITILQAGTKRYIRPNCKLMVHYGEDSQESLSDAKHNKELVEDYINIMKDRVSVGHRTVRSWLHKNTYFNSKRAIKVGLVDGIYDE